VRSEKLTSSLRESSVLLRASFAEIVNTKEVRPFVLDKHCLMCRDWKIQLEEFEEAMSIIGELGARV
jgi:hypothetical protein